MQGWHQPVPKVRTQSNAPELYDLLVVSFTKLLNVFHLFQIQKTFDHNNIRLLVMSECVAIVSVQEHLSQALWTCLVRARAKLQCCCLL